MGQRRGSHVPHRGAGTSAARRDAIPQALRRSRALDGGDAEDCVREARGEGRAEQHLFTMILADRTSPIAMHFWSDGGTGHVDMLTLLYEALWPGQTLLLRCEDVIVKRMPQTTLVPMQRFVSTDSTQIFAWTVMEDTYLALSKPAPVESALFLRDFRALSARGPYTCSVLGVVACVGEMRVLAHGVP